MSVLSKDAEVAVRWSTAERVAALKQIVPQAAIRVVLQKTGRGRVLCRRLPRWFVVWFVIAMGLFCRDSYRPVFRCLHRFRKGGTPGRSTLCEARHSVGVAPLRLLAEQVIQRQARPDTPQVIHEWLSSNSIRVLNVAGPRESSQPGITRQAVTFLRTLLGHTNPKRKRGNEPSVPRLRVGLV